MLPLFDSLNFNFNFIDLPSQTFSCWFLYVCAGDDGNVREKCKLRTCLHTLLCHQEILYALKHSCFEKPFFLLIICLSILKSGRSFFSSRTFTCFLEPRNNAPLVLPFRTPSIFSQSPLYIYATAVEPDWSRESRRVTAFGALGSG